MDLGQPPLRQHLACRNAGRKRGARAQDEGKLAVVHLLADFGQLIEYTFKIPNFYRLQLRIDAARDAKDAADGKPDGARRPGAGGELLRPSLAARREALTNTDGKAAPVGTIAPAPTAPATPLLTTEQKKAIVQTITATPQKTEPVAPTTPLTTQRTAPVVTPLQK